VRVVDHPANRTFSIIVGSFQPAHDPNFNQTWAALLYRDSNGVMRTYQRFVREVNITERGQPVTHPTDLVSPAIFEFAAPTLGTLLVNDSLATLDFDFGNLSVSANLSRRVPWDPKEPNGAGPEGWIGHISKVLPCNYFVQTLASEVVYSINEPEGETLGTGFAHSETNYGVDFPDAWVWAQAISVDGKSQLLLTGGAFVIAGISTHTYVVAFRAPGREWNFRTTDLDIISPHANACNATLELIAETPLSHRRISLSILAPQDSFSDPLFFPTATGFSDKPGCVESYSATATVTTSVGGRDVQHHVFPLAALEFGGKMRCSE